MNNNSHKIKLFFLGLLHSLIFYLAFSSPVKAGSFVVSPSDIQAIESSFGTLESLGQMQYGIVPVNSDFYEDSIDVFNSDFLLKDSHTTLTNDQFSVETMPLDVLNDIIDGKYGTYNGVNYSPVLSQDGVSYAYFDNGYYSGHCLVYNGQILYTLDSQQNPVRACDVKYGGSQCTVSDYKNALSSYSSTVRNNLYNYGGQTGQSYSYYLCIGLNSDYCESVFISNQYLPGLIVPISSSNGETIQGWYTNDLSLIQNTMILGDSSDSYLDIQEGDYEKGNFEYSYMVRFFPNRNFEGYSIDGSLSDFLDGVSLNSPVLGRIGYYFSNSLLNDAIPFYPVAGDVIDLDDTYALDDVIAFPLPGVSDFRDNLAFDPTLPVSDTNYPIAIELDDGIVSDPSIDAPIDIVIPDVPVGDIGNIPVLSNLQRRFPFSIPFDIYYLMNGLSVQREAPHFEWELYFPVVDYTWEIDIDLSSWNTQASIFRTCFLILFIIGLGMWAYNHFFGT